ncbi:MAG: DUF4430 domain-containing protein [Clostridia bacterium]|nr:DUF4430 domain-containing protein [Clostridia bacterium]
MKKAISISIACLVLLSSVFFIVGCGDKESETELNFTFKVVHLDGTEKTFDVKTCKTILGDALTEKGYISGFQSQYGLSVETVDGETHKWGGDIYWMLYINGELSPTGVDSTKIVDGATYTFKAEKV